MALSFPGPLEILFLLMLLALPAVVILLVLRRKPPAAMRTGFPLIPTADEDGPGSYRVVGVDKGTRADRAITIEADSRANAQVKAELEGIVVTAVTKAQRP